MKIALVGNQNSGKTTLFNTLTGTNQKVGNWPGVTIDRKEGIIKSTNFTLIDLPGVYSLSPYTSEEDISRKFILNDKPDCIINIIDATSLERSLYLTTQLLELDTRVVVVLNMTDLLSKKGITIDAKALSQELKTEVFEISALKNTGIDSLINYLKVISFNKYYTHIDVKIYDETIEKCITDITNRLDTHYLNKRFLSVKMIEEDTMFQGFLTDEIKNRINDLKKTYTIDMEQVIADQRYNYIESIRKKVMIKSHFTRSITDKLDLIFLNKWLAIPIFAIIMFLIYYLAVGVIGSATVDFVDEVVTTFSSFVHEILVKWGASEWASSLVCDGIIKGVGAVLNFIPQLMILFMCICILETSGYMSRIAFFLDKLFIKLGLSGKSLIPFIVGAGCSVPAIMTTRTIENEREKETTIMLTPFIPCSAKLPIITLFVGAFFDNVGLVSASLYFFSVVVIILSALLLKKITKQKDSSTFISELPEYKVPSLKYVARDVFDKTGDFLKRAGSIILICSVVVWFTLSFSWKMEYGVPVDKSILASIGNALAWIFYPILGTWSWEATVSSIQGLVAKEQVVSSMNIIAGLQAEATNSSALFSTTSFAFFTPPSAYAYCVFNLFSAPCFGAIGAMKKELKSMKKVGKALLLEMTMAWTLASLVFLIGSIFY